ncbi:MAG: 30S ribosomal protein S12 methylthiotransferase RimO [Lachnospiraceae bacterium]|nr:30S ribosomal protein S12 methylthiotransferase RimO [Lachnospiraceae bacterium]
MKKKLCLISLGCDKNLVDSEMLLGHIYENTAYDYEFTDDESAADVIIINTCCFILDAKQESIDTILRAAEYKHSGILKELIVMGCLAERYKDEIISEIPEVDRIITIPEFEKKISLNPPEHRMISTGGWYAYLKIAEGCNKRCTYCIIPYLRGNYRSYPMDNLLSQARDLADAGVKELIIVAQETTVYGIDLYGRKMLPELLHELCKIEGFRWIRIMYTYPEEITDELISTIASEPKICHYIDMPIQHASDAILRRMGRLTSRADIENVIFRLRDAIPDIVIRTSLITGFPGETQEDHNTLKEFVDGFELERVGVFTYSPEDGTPAEKYKDQVSEDIKESRRDDLMSLQQEISTAFLDSLIGSELDVLIEGWLPDDGVAVGRTYMDAPSVDGMIFVKTRKRYDSGTFIKAKVTGSSEYDLIGEEI